MTNLVAMNNSSMIIKIYKYMSLKIKWDFQNKSFEVGKKYTVQKTRKT